MSKYHAVRHNGYASKREASKASDLHLLAKAGAITELKEQVRFELLPAGAGYKRPLYYIADFVFVEKGIKKIVDVKGFKTRIYIIKKRLMKQLLGLDIEEM